MEISTPQTERKLHHVRREFDFDVSVANDVSIDVAKWALPVKVMQGLLCPEVHTLTNDNGRYMVK